MKFIFYTIGCLVLITLCSLVILGKYYSPYTQIERNQFLSTHIYAENGSLIREFPSQSGSYSTWISLNQINSYLISATLVKEDKRFFHHMGIDPIASSRALLQWVYHGKVKSGASTLSQQIIRILKNHPRNFRAKLKVMFQALWLDLYLSKAKQLEFYFNLAPYGKNYIGVHEASWQYFRTPAQELSLAQAAFLAVIPQSPSKLNPRKNLTQVIKRQQKLLKQMLAANKISQREFDFAILEKIHIYPEIRPMQAMHFSEFILTQNSKHSGKKIYSSLNLNLQKKIEKIVHTQMAKIKKYNAHQAAVLVIDNKSSQVLAWIGSKDYFDNEYLGKNDGVLALRQPGSALKPFTYALALKNNFTAASILPDLRTQYYLNSAESYIPRNYNRVYHGPVRLRMALAGSLNITAIHVAKKIGIQKIYNLFSKLKLRLSEPAWHYGLGITLGNAEVRLHDLTYAYSTLGREGQYLSPLYYSLSLWNQMLQKKHPVLDKNQVTIITDILQDSLSRDHFFGQQNPFHFAFPFAIKTGTSSNWKDNWSFGYNQDFTVGVWVGNFNGSPMEGTSGATGAGPILKAVAQETQKLYPHRHQIYQKNHLSLINICPLSGKLRGPYCLHSMKEFFIPGTEPKSYCQYHQKVWIDQRNQLLAGSQCPKKYAVLRNKVIYPKLFQNWAKNSGKEVLSYSPLCPETQKLYFTLSFPQTNSKFKIDPSEDQEFQSIPLEISSNIHFNSIEWFVDGNFYRTQNTNQKIRWILEKGKHKIQAKLGSQYSDSVEIEVE